MRIVATVILLAAFKISFSQDASYREIPSYPDSFSASNVLARMIDGLGYRYFWATQGLTKKDLEFRPTSEARSSLETIEHLLGLSSIIRSSVKGEIRKRPETKAMSFDEIRSATLKNLRESSLILKQAVDVEEIHIRFSPTDSLPVWNLINGPIADAIYHTGQVVSFRRSSGNPINPKVNVMMGSDPEK